jgi:drug/metabolite transporter (DMT)-like permease
MTSRGSRAMRVVPGARHWPFAALLLASVLWGGAITGTKYALRAFDPVTLLSVELVATAALWTVLLIRGYRLALAVDMARWAGRPDQLPIAVAPRYWLAASALGVGGFALSFLIYNKVISAVNVGWAAIVLNLIPAFGLLSSMVFLGEEPTRGGIIGACLIGGSVIYFTTCHSRAIEPDLSPAGGP